MGNCFVCFKQPITEAPGSFSQEFGKKDMPEEQTHLNPAPTSQPPTPPDLNPIEPRRTTKLDLEAETIESNGHLNANITIKPSAKLIAKKSKSANSSIKSNIKSILSNDLTMIADQHDAKINELFDKYKDTIDDAILAEGMQTLCDDLELDPDDFRILLLAWRLQAKEMCKFTRSEFDAGFKCLSAFDVPSLRSSLDRLMQEVELNETLFKDLYKFTFNFGVDGGGSSRVLSRDMAIVLWRLVFTKRTPVVLNRWLEFLDGCGENLRGITRDTWMMFLNFSEMFCERVEQDGSKVDLSAYDDSEAWPSLFDDFVEWENDQTNQNVMKKDDKCGFLL